MNIQVNTLFSLLQKRNKFFFFKRCPQGEQYNIYTWLVKKKKITMHICMFIYMHRRMGTICFLSKSQNFFTLPLAQKWFFPKKKREHSSYD